MKSENSLLWFMLVPIAVAFSFIVVLMFRFDSLLQKTRREAVLRGYASYVVYENETMNQPTFKWNDK
jgi:hypothetical protein